MSQLAATDLLRWFMVNCKRMGTRRQVKAKMKIAIITRATGLTMIT
jgi:hypothetical protein